MSSPSRNNFYLPVCSLLDESRFNVVLDLTWTKNAEIHQLCNSLDIPYFKADTTIYPVIDVAVALLQSRNGADGVFILDDEALGQQTLHGLIQNANIRVLVLNRLGREETDMLRKLRPIPQFFTVVAETMDMNDLFKVVSCEKLGDHSLKLVEFNSRRLKVVLSKLKIDGICYFWTHFKVISSTRTLI